MGGLQRYKATFGIISQSINAADPSSILPWTPSLTHFTVLEIVRIVVEEDEQRVAAAGRAFVDDVDDFIGRGEAVYRWKVDEQRKKRRIRDFTLPGHRNKARGVYKVFWRLEAAAIT